jgi:activator of HSP90 ATPase
MAIHQDIVINGTPKAVYEILTSSKKFTAMSNGSAAKISRDGGGAISMFGGAIQGRNVELVSGRRVVQAWRSKDWKDGVYSIVRFELTADGKNTKLSFDQVGHPADEQSHMERGWEKMYWAPMNAFLLNT